MPTSDSWSGPGAALALSYSGKLRNWVVTPNFGALQKDQKPVNYYTDEKRDAGQVRYTAYYQVKSTGVKTYSSNNIIGATGQQINPGLNNGWWDPPAVGNDWTSRKADAINSAKVGALLKMADAKVNIAVALAEASKTSDLILDTARRIDRAYRAFRKGDLKGVAKNLNITPKKLHNSWLEYKYGWMPLLMDVKGAAEFFAQQHVVRAPRFTVVKNEQIDKIYRYEVPRAVYGSTTQTTQQRYYLEGSFACKVKYWCELSNPHLSELQQIGLTNPLLVAWELVPYSFVFDWFIQVGDWLTALTASQGVTIRRVLYSQIEIRGGTYDRDDTLVSDATYNYFESGGHFRYQTRRYDRAPQVPLPASIYPPMKVNFGFAKTVTSLALIKGSYRGKARL